MSRLAPILRSVLLAAALLASRTIAHAATWQPAGPDGGSVGALAVDPTDPDTVYASTFLGSVFKTTDGGESWRALPGFPVDSAESLAVDPAHPQTVYAAVSYHGI